jgi:hypothetical protein
LTPSRSDSGIAETIHRWRTRNSADTREADGPDGRVYTVPFATVWDELLGLVEGQGRWRLKHRDEELGIITVSCTTPVLRFVDDLTIWVALDSHGLTRVEMLSRSRRGQGDMGTNGRRVERLLKRLDDRVGPSNRVVDRRGGPRSSRETPGRASPSDDGATFA